MCEQPEIPSSWETRPPRSPLSASRPIILETAGPDDAPHNVLIDREPIKPQEFDSEDSGDVNDAKQPPPAPPLAIQESVKAAWDKLEQSLRATAWGYPQGI